MKTMELNITGGNKKERAIVAMAAALAKRYIMPTTANLYIEIEIIRGFEMLGAHAAYSKKEHIIELKAELEILDLIKTVIHEFVHIHQYHANHLRYNPLIKCYRWKDTIVREDVGYNNYPWEHDAYEKELTIFNKILVDIEIEI
jgi:hypothetical protein